MNPTTIKPQPQQGGSSFGWHYLALFKTCQRKWALEHRFPNMDPEVETKGIRPISTSAPLMIGSMTHDGLEAWYRSGWQDGQYQLAPALDQVLTTARVRSREFESPEDQAKAIQTAEQLIRNYHEYYGPGGAEEEWPQFQIASDTDGNPLVEKEFVISVGDGHYFSARFDGIVWVNQSYLGGWEFKTTAATWANRLRNRCTLDGQMTGQVAILRTLFPEEKFFGVVVTALVKDRGKKSPHPPFYRDAVSRSEVDTALFLRDTKRTLKIMEERDGEFEHGRQAEIDPWDSLLLAYDGTPDANNCVGNFSCPFLMLCQNKEMASKMIETQYRPKMVVKEEEDV